MKKKAYLPLNEKLFITRVIMIASTAIVTIKPSQVVAIALTSVLAPLIAVEAVAVTPEEELNLSRAKTPTPINIDTSTISRTNW